MIRAVGLLSGGLDSTLAAKVLIDQGIEVFAVNFTSPFCTCTPKSAGCASVITAVRQLGGIPLKRIAMGQDYLDMVRAPKHGYGRGMNPCIDCRILKLKKAAEYMREIGAQFLFTGEVLGQRPMSQHRRALAVISEESGIGDLIVRPLSAQVLDPTVPEKEGWVDRARLLAIVGRSRKQQMSLAKDKGILEYSCPAGGCLLTDGNFAARLKDYFDNTARPALHDMPLLRIGRHYRTGKGDWIIVSRDEPEGERLEAVHRSDAVLLLPENFSAPVVLVVGSDVQEGVAKMLLHTHKAIPADALLRVRSDESARVLTRKEWP